MRQRRAELEQWAAQANWAGVLTVVCLGYGADDPWEAFHRHKRVRVVVFDPDAAAKPKGAIPADCWVCRSIIDLRTLLCDVINPAGRVEYVADDALFAQWGELFIQAIHDGTAYALSRESTNRNNTEVWTETQLELLPRMVGTTPINRVDQCFAGKTGVLVAGGPSLDASLDMIKRAQGHAVICAVNTAVGPLEAAGIQPDIVCVAETNGTSVEPILGATAYKAAVVVLGAHAFPPAWDAAETKLSALMDVGSIGQLLVDVLDVKPVDVGGSVSTFAYRVLEHLGCNAIVVVGLDCACGKEGTAHHARDVARTTPAMVNGNHPVKAWGGAGEVLATGSLSQYRYWFETRAQSADRPQLINASKGGARIHGWIEVPPDDVVFTDDPFDARAILLAASAQCEPIEAQPIVDALRYEQQAAADIMPVVSQVSDAANAAVDGLDAYMQQATAARVLRMYALGPVNELGELPTRNNLETFCKTFARIVERNKQLKPLLAQAISAIEGQHV